jgi:hypothetical protein
MSDTDRTTVPRRAAFRVTLAALAAAGAASAFPTGTSAWPGAPTPARVAVDQATLDEAARQATAESRRTLLVTAALSDQDDWETYETVLMDHLEATQAMYVAELARHLPAFAVTINALWPHVLKTGHYSDELCCQDGPESGW